MVYTDGSARRHSARLGAAVIHQESDTTIHIDATGHQENHTIRRAS